MPVLAFTVPVLRFTQRQGVGLGPGARSSTRQASSAASLQTMHGIIKEYPWYKHPRSSDLVHKWKMSVIHFTTANVESSLLGGISDYIPALQQGYIYIYICI